MNTKQLVPALNDETFAPLGRDLGPGMNPAGLICAANESRFVGTHYQEGLTGFTVGWTDRENLIAQRESMFPEVVTSRRFEFKKALNAEAYLTETDDERPIGAPFKRVEYKSESVESKTKNHGLTVRIDHDETDDLEGEVRRTIDRLLGRTTRNSFRRGVALLEANDVNSAEIWGATDNPDGDLRTMGRASADVTGVWPNVWAMGELAWHFRLNAYEDSARDNGGQRAMLSREQLAQYLGADRVEVVKARYQSTATVKAVQILAVVYAYLAIQGASKDDPTAVKRFISMARGGGNYGVYRQDREKYTDVSLEYYERLVLTGIGIESRTITES